MDFEDGSMMKNATGVELYCKYWKPELGPDEKPRALVFIVHGYAEHCRKYDHVAQFLNEKKFFVFAHDHVGHGQSKGDRALVDKFSIYIDDIFQHVDKVKEALPDVPFFLLGHSMGGTIALLAGIERPEAMKGIGLIGAAITFDITPFKSKLVKFVSFVYKGCGLLTLDPKSISRDAEVVKQYEEDPLVFHGSMKAGMANELLGAMEQVQNRMEEIKVALLIQHGTADTITLLSGARLLNEKAAAYDKTLSIYQDAFHQLHNEPHGMKDQVLSEIADWFESRL